MPRTRLRIRRPFRAFSCLEAEACLNLFPLKDEYRPWPARGVWPLTYGCCRLFLSRITETTEGPKVWDLLSVDDLDRHFVGGETAMLELLARSGLIANEMRCRCGSEMYLRRRRPYSRTLEKDASTPTTPFYYRVSSSPRASVRPLIQWRVKYSEQNLSEVNWS